MHFLETAYFTEYNHFYFTVFLNLHSNSVEISLQFFVIIGLDNFLDIKPTYVVNLNSI